MWPVIWMYDTRDSSVSKVTRPHSGWSRDHRSIFDGTRHFPQKLWGDYGVKPTTHPYLVQMFGMSGFIPLPPHTQIPSQCVQRQLLFHQESLAFLINYQSISWSRYPPLNESRSLIAVITTVRHWSLCKPVKSSPHCLLTKLQAHRYSTERSFDWYRMVFVSSPPQHNWIWNPLFALSNRGKASVRSTQWGINNRWTFISTTPHTFMVWCLNYTRNNIPALLEIQ
jgi:hypothetical protein